jgi:hypothetical protein
MLNSTPLSTVYEGTITFAAVSSGAVATQTVTLPTGVTFQGPTGVGGAPIHLELKDLQAGLIFSNAFALTSTTFKVTFYNSTGGSLTPTGTNAKLVQF